MNMKIVIIAFLIVIIVAAVVFGVIQIRTQLKGPTTYLDMKFPKIDMNSYEVFSATRVDWATRYAPDASGHYKNPKTGTYTVVDMMKCASCGQPIPVPPMPPDLWSKASLAKYTPRRSPGRRGPAPEFIAKMAAIQAWESNYKCPRCGQNAFEFPPSPIQNNAGEQKKLSDQKKANEQKTQSESDLESARKPIQELLGK
jgi:hypothetical protein